MGSNTAVLERPVSSLHDADMEEARLVSGLLAGEAEEPNDDLLALYQSEVADHAEALDEDSHAEPAAEAEEAAEDEYVPEPVRPDRDEELHLWMSRARVAQLLTADEEIRLARAVQRGDKRAKDK